jgi:hypothetical protein
MEGGRRCSESSRKSDRMKECKCDRQLDYVVRGIFQWFTSDEELIENFCEDRLLV